MENVNVGIIGFGRIGKIHFDHLTKIPGTKVTKVADPYFDDEAFAAQFETDFIKDGAEIIADESIDAVYICCPTDQHIYWIKEAAQAGKHIFCEKPISDSDEETLAAFDIVKESGVKFQLGVNRRFDRNFSGIREYIEEGRIGQPQLLAINSYDPEAPPLSYVEVSGGLFFDMMIHDFDMARYIMGSEVTEVFAVGEALINEDIKQYGDVDTAIVTLKFANGAIGTITNSRQAVYGYDQRLEVLGSEGGVEAKNELNNQIIVSDREGSHHSNPQHFFLERYAAAYAEEDREFIEAIQNDTDTPVAFEDGIMAQRLAFAAQESYQTGKPVQVQLM